MSAPSETIRRSPVKLTYEQYALFSNDGMRHEIIDGRHYMSPAPSLRHQEVSRYLQFLFFTEIELTRLGVVINAPVDVQLSPTDVVQPDLIIVLKGNRITTPSRVRGAPDLVIEILSPSNREYDLNLKKQVYEQFLVPEYWVVDPEDQTVLQFRLGDDLRYQPAISCTEAVTFFGLPEPLVIDLKKVW